MKKSRVSSEQMAALIVTGWAVLAVIVLLNSTHVAEANLVPAVFAETSDIVEIQSQK